MRNCIFSIIIVFSCIIPTKKIMQKNSIFRALNAMSLWHIETCGVVNITRLYHFRMVVVGFSVCQIVRFRMPKRQGFFKSTANLAGCQNGGRGSHSTSPTFPNVLPIPS